MKSINQLLFILKRFIVVLHIIISRCDAYQSVRLTEFSQQTLN